MIWKRSSPGIDSLGICELLLGLHDSPIIPHPTLESHVLKAWRRCTIPGEKLMEVLGERVTKPELPKIASLRHLFP